MENFNGLEVEGRLIASTAFKYGRGWDLAENPWAWCFAKAGLMDIGPFGAFITKTITLHERNGFYTDKLMPWKVVRFYPDRILNRFGWNNCGIRNFTETELPKLGPEIKKCIVSIGALDSPDEIFAMLDILNGKRVAGIELNISCHNVDLRFLNDLRVMKKLFSGARKISRHPLIVKLSAESDYSAIARLAQDEGINLLHVMNTLRVYSKALGGFCGQSGYANKKTALRIISRLRAAGISLPIIGGSGIWTVKDIQTYENAGADLFSLSHQFLYLPFWPGVLARIERSAHDRTQNAEKNRG